MNASDYSKLPLILKLETIDQMIIGCDPKSDTFKKWNDLKNQAHREYLSASLDDKIEITESRIYNYDTGTTEYKKWQEKIIQWKEEMSCKTIK